MASTPKPFRFPFSPPEPHEVAALVQASAYLLRAANEAESQSISPFGRSSGHYPSDDLPPALAAAGHLCRAVIDVARATSTD